jgi:sortase A
MKLPNPTNPASAFLLERLGFASNALFLAGALLLVPPLVHRLIGLRAQSSASLPVAPPPAARRAAERPATRVTAEGEPLGRLEIPRIGLDLAVFEGTSDATLFKGPGHLSGTAWPAAAAAGGNCVIAGHRDSFFRALENARAGDEVRLAGAFGVDTYRLAQRRIVRPREVSVLAATAEPRLTLVTCYPFRWWGRAPLRLVWTAERIDAEVAASR